MSEHGGTHLDAPFHFNKFGWKLAEIPLNRLVDIPAVLVDVEKEVFALEHPDEFFLDVEHLLEHEKKFGRIPPGSVVFARFGWGKFWPDKKRYLGLDNSTGELSFHFPGLSGNAASWLLRERKIVGYGSDTAAADAEVNTQGNNVVHIILLENQVYIIENLANLDNLLRKTRPNDLHGSNRYCKDLRAFIHPIKTLGTGGPANVVAHCRKWEI